MIIRQMQHSDLEQVLQIYRQGLETKIATFETIVPTKGDWHASHHKTLRFVAETNDQIIAWIALSQVSNRKVYCGVGEISIYISELARGKGIGTALMNKMIQKSEEAGYWTLQSSISSKNQASLALHLKVGFRVVGTREKIAKRDGEWQDTIIMERRSRVVF